MTQSSPPRKRGLPMIGPEGLVRTGGPVPALVRGKGPTVLVPSEQVVLRVVDLPVASHRQRLAALPFAMEGMLAEPLDAVHVALGPKIAPQRYLAAAVRHEVMAGWIARLPASHAKARLLPDALTLPRPAEGWMIWTRGARSLVRASDGSGFAVPAAVLPAAWKAAGKPPLEAFGESAPGFSVVGDTPPRRADPVAMGFDLRQGQFAVGGAKASGAWMRAAAAVLVLGALAHGGIAAADVSALRELAAEKRAGLETLLREVAPGMSARGDAATVLTGLLPRGEAQGGGRFLPLFARASAALVPVSDGLSIETLSYSEQDGALTLTVEANDLAALQRIEAALSKADLSPVVGAATTGQGSAEARFVLRDPAGGV